MYESSGLHFFRTTTGIQSRQHIFEELRLVLTFLTNLGIIKIFVFRLSSRREVLEKKAGKEILESPSLEFLANILAYNFDLTDEEDNTLGPLNRADIADFSLLITFLANC